MLDSQVGVNQNTWNHTPHGDCSSISTCFQNSHTRAEQRERKEGKKRRSINCQLQYLVAHSSSAQQQEQRSARTTERLTHTLGENVPVGTADMPGRAENKGSRTPTRAHTVAEFDAWRSRQELASKTRSSRAQGNMGPPEAVAAGGGGAPYHHRRRTSAAGPGGTGRNNDTAGAGAAAKPLLPITKV